MNLTVRQVATTVAASMVAAVLFVLLLLEVVDERAEATVVGLIAPACVTVDPVTVPCPTGVDR